MLGLQIFYGLIAPCFEPRNHEKVIEHLRILGHLEKCNGASVDSRDEQEEEVKVQQRIHWSINWFPVEPSSHEVPKRKEISEVESSGSHPGYVDQ